MHYSLMRRQRMLGASLSPSLRLLCIARSSRTPLSRYQCLPIRVPTCTACRTISTTRSPFQQAAAAVAVQENPDTDNTHSDGFLYNPDSSLSAAEQREKFAMRQRREAFEAQQRYKLDRQRGDQHDAARAVTGQQSPANKRQQNQGVQADVFRDGRSQSSFRTGGLRQSNGSDNSNIQNRSSPHSDRSKQSSGQQTTSRPRSNANPYGPAQSQRQAPSMTSTDAGQRPRNEPERVGLPNFISPSGGAGEKHRERSGFGRFGMGRFGAQSDAPPLDREALRQEAEEARHRAQQNNAVGPSTKSTPELPWSARNNSTSNAIDGLLGTSFSIKASPPRETKYGSFGRNPVVMKDHELRGPDEEMVQKQATFDNTFAQHMETAKRTISETRRASNQGTDLSLEPTSLSASEQREKEALRQRRQQQQQQQQQPYSGDLPSMQQGYAPYSSSGYQATPIDPRERQQRQQQQPQGLVEDPAAHWQHLRRRNSEPPPHAPLQPQQSQQTQQPFEDDAWIDRRFQEHQQQRQAVAQQQQYFREQYSFQPQRAFASEDGSVADSGTSNNPNIQDVKPNARRKCARCGQLGHVARECPKMQSKTTCRLCGQAGHHIRDCPQNTRPMVRSVFNPATHPERASSRTANNGSSEAAANPFDDPVPRVVRSRDDVVGDSKNTSDELPEIDSKRSKERLARRSRWAADDEDGVEAQSHRRKGARRRNEDGDEDDDMPSIRRPSRGFRDDDDLLDDDAESRGEMRARREQRKSQKERERKKREKEKRDARAAERRERAQTVELPEFVSVQNLAQTLGVRYEAFVERLEDLGYDDVFPGKILNTETSGMIAMEYNFEPTFSSDAAAARQEEDERDLKALPPVSAEDKEYLPTRPPVVTIMGHVDHGKTTILDYLRKSSVAAGEAGGITQHIGAFSVPLSSSGKTITFLDTPGHAAFLAMRQRGANVTDIVILVVAADDSVKPQTLEAIKHARGAGVPMIVAVNKVDKEEADVQRVKQDLARHGVEIEDYGGDTQVVCVSGKSGQGMDELEEAAVTLSEILDHRADQQGNMEGWVLEATTKKAGRVATVLVRRGTLRPGAVIVAGKTWARVRTLRNEAGVAVHEIGPGMPVEVDGWRDQPSAGDEVLQAPSEQKATSVVDFRLEKDERERTAADMEAINEARRLEQVKRAREKAEAAEAAAAAKKSDPADDSLSSPSKPTTADEPAEDLSKRQQELPFIIKADVSGSAEALQSYLQTLISPLITPTLLPSPTSSVGQINESDIDLAATAGGHIIAFNLPADEAMSGLAASKGVKVLRNDVIYRVLDDVKAMLEEKLPPIVTQRVLGEAEVGAAFDIGVGGRKKAKVAGCKVRNGVVAKGGRVRVMRGEAKIYDGTINSLKNVKKEVGEMRKGSECGMGFENWEGFEVGDLIQTYEERSEKRKL